MPTVTESKVLDHDVSTVYNQWTQFEDFPRFMEHVERVEQLDDRRLRWVADFGGSTHEWDAEITEQVPDECIAWRSIDGKTQAGQVTFRRAGPHKTMVTVQMRWEPEGLKEKVGGALGFDERQIRGDLDRLESCSTSAAAARAAPGAASSTDGVRPGQAVLRRPRLDPPSAPREAVM